MTLYVLHTPRKTIAGTFISDRDAMATAQDLGALVPASNDEGGARFAVLAPGWTIERIEAISIEDRHRTALQAAYDACDLTAPAGQDKYSQGWIACREKCRAAIRALMGE